MKMKRDDLLMIILTVIILLGGVIYYIATQIQQDSTSGSYGENSSMTSTGSTSVDVDVIEPTVGGTTTADSEKGGKSLSASTPTVQVILNGMERVIGGTLNGLWVDATTIGHYLQGGEVYKFYLDFECVGERASAPFDQSRDFIENDKTYLVTMQEGPEPIIEFTFAQTGNWDPFIRKAQSVNEKERFQPAVQALLKERSMLNSDVVIREVYKIDIEGDGTDEYVILASNCTEEDVDKIANEVDFSREDKYSFVILEKARKNYLLFERTQSIYDVTITCADLDGDKEIEFLIHDENYETLVMGYYTLELDTIVKFTGTRASEVAAVVSTQDYTLR